MAKFDPPRPVRRERTPKQRQVAADQSAAIRRQQREAGGPDPFERVNGRRPSGRRFRPVEVSPGRNAYAAPDDLLALADGLTDQMRTRLRELGFSLRVSHVLRDRLVQLVKPDASADDIAAARDVIGKNTSVSYVTPYRMVMKSGATPEDVDGAVPEHTAVTGSTVRVAILDTGITAEQRTDGWLRGLVSTTNEDPLNVLPLGNRDCYLDLAAGHGTFVAGVVAQVAPDADPCVHRVLDTDGVATDLQVGEALVRLVSEDLRPGGRLVVNLSLGTETPDDRPPLALSVALDVVREIERARHGEVMVVAAAGNEGRARKCWPGAFDDVVAVAALGEDGNPAAWSSHGDWVRCSTIGEAVLSTYVEGSESPVVDPQPETFGTDAWAYWTGTSFCAPQVAGAVAHLAAQNDSSLADALTQLLAGEPSDPDYGTLLTILP